MKVAVIVNIIYYDSILIILWKQAILTVNGTSLMAVKGDYSPPWGAKACVISNKIT